MKTPTLEEVKAYFKDAKEIQCIFDSSKIYEINKNNIEFKYDEYWVKVNGTEMNLWDKIKGYAKIITKTEPTYKITKETILKYNMKDEFPDVFEVKLEVEKWYKCNYTDKENKSLIFVSDISGKNIDGFGFDFNGKWFDERRNCGTISELYRLATTEEVEEALINEAKKRYKVGDFIKNIGNYLCGNSNMLFGGKDFCIDSDGSFCVKSTNNYFIRIMDNNGKWAEKIPTMSLKEAEELLKKLGNEIKIVS